MRSREDIIAELEQRLGIAPKKKNILSSFLDSKPVQMIEKLNPMNATVNMFKSILPDGSPFKPLLSGDFKGSVESTKDLVNRTLKSSYEPLEAQRRMTLARRSGLQPEESDVALVRDSYRKTIETAAGATEPLKATNKLLSKADDIVKSIKQAKSAGQSFDDWVKGLGIPKYQHSMIRKTAESDLGKIKSEGFHSQYVEAFNQPAKPFQSKFSMQPNVAEIGGGGQWSKTKKGETILLVPEEAIINGKNGNFIKPGWKPKDSDIVRIEFDGQNPLDIRKAQLKAEWDGGDDLYDISSLPGSFKKLNVTDDVKSNIGATLNKIKPELGQMKGRPMTDEEVISAAKESDILRRATSREQTLKEEAAILRTRQHLAELAKGEVNAEFIDTLRIISAEEADRGRQLRALGIGADPELNTVKAQLIKKLIKIGTSTEEILKKSAGVDFTNAAQVTKFYREFVKPTFAEVLDEYRYINLLSSPKTHIVNSFTNMLQVAGLRPATMLASGVVDTIGSRLFGKEQTHYVSQIPAYYRGVTSSVGEALGKFYKALKGESILNRPDLAQIPTGSKMLKPFMVIPRLLEASDAFFRTLANSGELNALMSRGLSREEALPIAAKQAERLVFRKALDPSNKSGQGYLLSSIDKMTNGIYGLRKVPGVKWFVPFVQTPMNILKQGIEYSPIGLATLPGNVDKIEQIGKTLVGSSVFAGAGWLALNDRTTFSAPTNQKDKEYFYNAGLQPYSIKIGDKWVSYSKLGPLAYPIAMAAAIKHYTKQNPNSVKDSDLQKIGNVIGGIAKFFSDQSYVQGMASLVSLAQGEATASVQALSNIPSQLIPLESLLGWVTNIVDPIYRKTDSKLSVDAIINNLKKGIPGLSTDVEAYRTPLGGKSKRQMPLLNALSPASISEEKNIGLYNRRMLKRRIEIKANDMKEKIQEKLKNKIFQ